MRFIRAYGSRRVGADRVTISEQSTRWHTADQYAGASPISMAIAGRFFLMGFISFAQKLNVNRKVAVFLAAFRSPVHLLCNDLQLAMHIRLKRAGWELPQ